MIAEHAANEMGAEALCGGDPEFQFALREANHRMANTLAILASSLRRSLSQVEDEQARGILRDHAARIVSFGNLHRHFMIGTANVPVELASYIHSLCENLIAAILAPAGIKCDAIVSEGVIDGQKCEIVGRIISELVTNAAKHAFPSGHGGAIHIQAFEYLGYWHCIVSDEGAGLRSPASGAGSQILDTLVGSLHGRIERRSGPSGTTVFVSFPGSLSLQATDPLAER